MSNFAYFGAGLLNGLLQAKVQDLQKEKQRKENVKYLNDLGIATQQISDTDLGGTTTVTDQASSANPNSDFYAKNARNNAIQGMQQQGLLPKADFLGQSSPTPTADNIGAGLGSGLLGAAKQYTQKPAQSTGFFPMPSQTDPNAGNGYKLISDDKRNAIQGADGTYTAQLPDGTQQSIMADENGYAIKPEQSPEYYPWYKADSSKPQGAGQAVNNQQYNFTNGLDKYSQNNNPVKLTTTALKTPAEAKAILWGQYIPKTAKFLAEQGHDPQKFMPWLLQDAQMRLDGYTQTYNNHTEQSAYNELEPLLTGDLSTPKARNQVSMAMSKYMRAMKIIGKDGTDVAKLVGQLFSNSNIEMAKEDNGGQYRWVVKDSTGNITPAPGQFGEWQDKTMTAEQKDSSARGWANVDLQKQGVDIQRRRLDLDNKKFEADYGMNEPSFEGFMRAIAGQESGGDYSAVNGRTGASGKYQIMPDNWPSWSREAGLDANAPMTPENQERVARFKLKQYYDRYGARGAAIAWYGGEGALNYSQDALNRKQGNGDEPSINEYANSILNRIVPASGGKYVNVPGVGRLTTEQALQLYERSKPQTTTTQNAMGETVRQSNGDPELHNKMGAALGMGDNSKGVDFNRSISEITSAMSKNAAASPKDRWSKEQMANYIKSNYGEWILPYVDFGAWYPDKNQTYGGTSPVNPDYFLGLGGD